MKSKSLKAFMIYVFIFIVVAASVLIFPTVKEGIDLYDSAIAEMSIEDKIDSIRSLPGYVSIKEISQCLKDATISVEDHRFYSHCGIDLISTGRAMIGNMINGHIVSGGSTITQQLAKNMYFSFEKKYSRKIAELIVARKLEEMLSKDEILELYLNVIYYGNGFYGIEQASKGYFNIEPCNLSNEQSVVLAGIPQSPNTYSLVNPNRKIKDRATIVITSMVENKYMKEAKAQDVVIKAYKLIEAYR